MKIGIVGAGGYWGPNWIRVLKQMKVLYAICDSNTERLEKVSQRYGLDNEVQKFVSYTEMLAFDLDAVFVVTPANSHTDHVIEALKKQKHVFVEKPLATNIADCMKMKKEMERSGKVLMVGHTFLYHPAIRKFKEVLSTIGALKSIYSVRANFGKYQKEGIIIDLLPHDLSIFNYLLDMRPIDFKLSINSSGDVAFVKVMYEKVDCGAFISWAYPDKTRKLIAVGLNGILEWDLSKTHLFLHRKWAELSNDTGFEHIDRGTENVMVYDQSEALLNEALHFIDCVTSQKRPMTDIENGIEVVRGIEKCLSLNPV